MITNLKTKIFIIALIAAANFSFGQTNYTIKAGDFVVDISTVKVKESPIWIGQWKGSLVLCPVLQVTNVNTNGPYTTLQFSSKLNGRFGSYDPFPAVALFLPYTNSPAPKEAVVLVEKPLKIIYTDPNRSVCISGSEPEVRQVGTQWLIEYGP